jgi:hypothetical protein
MLILPYVSLIAEKEHQTKELLKQLDLKMIALFSARRTQIKEDTNVIICTIEKANLIVNKLVMEG